MDAQPGNPCPSCGHRNRPERRFCSKCGRRLGEVCPACGTQNEPGEKFCGSCGAGLAGDAAAALAPGGGRPPAADAERRHLSVMFCDLVGSTELSRRLDPEELREVIEAYYAACGEVIERFDGYVAKYLGDGVLAYFGYPRAHEDDAVRAVSAGLGIVSALPQLNARLGERVLALPPCPLGVRIGVHSGVAVVGETGAGTAREESGIVGAVPNVAARLQATAAPNTVILSEATRRLVTGVFVLEELGAHELKGLPEPVPIYRAVGASGVRSRLEVAAAAGLTPFVGRQQEVGLLRDRWAQVQDGFGQAVLVSGDPGMGKSRLLQVAREELAREAHTWLECRGSAHHQNSPFYPVIELLEQGLLFAREDTPATKVIKLEQRLASIGFAPGEVLPLFAALLSLPVPERYTPPMLSAEAQRRKTLAALSVWFVALTAQQPVLLVVEDLHWIDPSTLELIGMLVEQLPTVPALLVLTFRPGFQPAWSRRSYVAELTLTRLTRKQVTAMLGSLTGGRTLPPGVLDQLVVKTDGVPLFVEELTKAVLESGLLEEHGGTEVPGPLRPLAIPATLQDSLTARLDRLGPAKEVAQLAATIGREFPYELLQAIAPLDEAALDGALGRLVEAELLYQRGVRPGATYMFKHAVIQEAAYETLLKVRRRRYHERIARVLIERFPALAATQPEVLAHHYTAAGLAREAVACWQQAAEHAMQRSANHEAASHLVRALELLHALPDTPERTQQELPVQTLLGFVYLVSRGYGAPEAEAAFSRARELCQQMGGTTQRARERLDEQGFLPASVMRIWPALRGLVMFYFIRGQLATARELGEELLALARSAQDHAMLVEAHLAMGWTLFWRGEFACAREVLAEGVATYDREKHRAHAVLYGQDPGISSLVAWGLTFWHLGYPDQARTKMEQALGLARELAHPYTLAFTLFAAAWLRTHLRDARGAHELAEAAIAIAAEQEFPHARAIATAVRGWALVEQGHIEAGIAEMRQGLGAADRIGAMIDGLRIIGLLAEAYGRAGHTEDGVAELARALERARAIEGCYYDAELHRIEGELLLQRSRKNGGEAEACFVSALEVARRQQARSLELRAATSLARLLRDQGGRVEARDVLAPVYAWFTEGFDTRDLVEAKALLGELG